MAVLRQQQPMLAGLGLLQLTLSVLLLFPPSEALPGNTKRSSSTSVEVVRGLFSRAILSLGYHKILEIPVGAQNITIRETIKSRNYLALGTGSGVSIINGNWAIDKPGVYLAAGTRLTYRRPNEVRSRTVPVSPSYSDTDSPSYTASPFYTVTVSPSYSDTDSPSYTASPFYTVTVSPSYSDTDSPSYTASPAYSDTDSPSYTASPAYSDTDRPSYTASPAYSDTDSPSYTASPAYSDTDSPSYTASPSYSDTDSPSYTVTASPSYSDTDSPVYTVTASPSYSDTDSPSYTASPSYSDTDSPSYTASPSYSDTDSPFYTVTDSPSYSDTDSPSPTVTVSPSHTYTDSPSYTASPSYSDTDSPFYTVTASPSYSDIDSPSHTDIVTSFNTIADFSTYPESNLIGNDIINEQEHTNQVPSHPFVSPDSWSSYIWTSTGHTPCTTTCGTGRRQVLWRCTERKTQTTVASDLCGPSLPPLNHEEDCNTQPCPAFWDLGEWSECSKRCGPGVQHRQVHCRQVTNNNSNGTVTMVTVGTDLCEEDVTAMPATSSPCQLKVCSQWQLRSDWSPCSVPCGVGQRSREVVCVGGTGVVEQDQECNLALKPDHLHNCDMGACARSWYTSLWSQRCSAECGKGKRTRASVCLVDHVTNLRLGGCEGERPQEVTSCDAGPCRQQMEWYAGPWGQCSAECGNGTQTRGVACLLRDEGRLQAVDQSKCFHLPQPISSQPCQLKLCGVQWYMTEWSACSRSCEGGYRVREVRCLADNMAPSNLCDPSLTPESSAECNPQPCVTDASVSCRDQYDNCVVVVQARLCVYPYYRTACCTSCSRVTNKHPYPYLKTQRRRHRTPGRYRKAHLRQRESRDSALTWRQGNRTKEGKDRSIGPASTSPQQVTHP
ncbi:thrombospondin type-1 domain-containing protein 4-like [Osmerus eperlanus]|uniref:thrombospondin type-1 domain-containing protein 4-like n=1 Tax=Osmerus eperlanus TaxID=29151 RepID=UPI002E15A606